MSRSVQYRMHAINKNNTINTSPQKKKLERMFGDDYHMTFKLPLGSTTPMVQKAVAKDSRSDVQKFLDCVSDRCGPEQP